MSKLLPLESLRGIAALTVVIFHFQVGSHFNNPFTENGFWMVNFFFVLSGFVICLSYRDRLATFDSLIQFQKRRFWRLYPLHFVMLVIFLGIETAKYLTDVFFNLEANNPPFVENNLASFLANLFLIQNWLLPNLTFNYPSWSISAEFFTYLIFAVTFVVTGNRKIFVPVIFIYILFAAAMLLYYDWDSGLISSGPAQCLYGFFLGVITFLVFDATKRYRCDTSIPAGVLIFLSVFSISNDQLLPEAQIFLPLIFSLTTLTLAKTSDQTFINRTLSHSCLVWLGTVSYGIYMIHAAVLWVLTQILRVVFKIPSKQGSEGETLLNITSVWFADLLIISAVIITLLFARLSYHKLEKPFYLKP